MGLAKAHRGIAPFYIWIGAVSLRTGLIDRSRARPEPNALELERAGPSQCRNAASTAAPRMGP